tara:strand:+ start:525 stop:980 length:456 start_codon:yes stop_codon:yes gene_type:complete
MSDKISLEITKKDYRKLVELVYLGVVLHHTYSKKEYKSMHKAEQAIYSQAKKFDCEDLINFIPQLNSFQASHDLMDRMDLFHVEYDYNTFYEELIERLAEKEFMRYYSTEQVMAMEQDKKDEALQYLREKYDAAALIGGLEKILETAKELF